MIISFRPARRWLQFSLRTFLVAVTIGCVWLGWTVEQARQRSRAIDAIVEAGGAVAYNDDQDWLPAPENHFWLDLKGIPVTVLIDAPVDATLGSNLARVNDIKELWLFGFSDADLEFLEGIQGKVDICLVHDTAIDSALERLQKRLPDAEVTRFLARTRPQPSVAVGYTW